MHPVGRFQDGGAVLGKIFGEDGGGVMRERVMRQFLAITAKGLLDRTLQTYGVPSNAGK